MNVRFTSAGKLFFKASVAAIFAAAVFLSSSETALADRRIFSRVYPYMTLPDGGMEIEHYLDAGYIEVDDPSTIVEEDGLEVSWQHQLELEYGITDRWDFGFYNVFRQEPFSDLEYRGIKLRMRYRFGDEGSLILDPAVYLEVAYFGDEAELEERIILSKKIGRAELSLNLKFETEFENEGASEWETEYAFSPILGAGYHLSERYSLGIEYFGEVEMEHGDAGVYSQYLGPVVSVSTSKFWWTIGAHPQLSDYNEAFEFQVRSILRVYL